VRRHGYKTVNLGVSGDTTTDMRRRIEQFMVEGKPEVAVVFGGANDVRQGIDPTDTKRNLTFIVEWLRERGVEEIVLIGPGVAHSTQSPAWASSIDTVRTVVREVAEDHDVVFVDLAQFLRDRVARGIDQNFSRVPYRQSRSWQISATDAHFNAYGQRLIAEAYLAATGP
jgi:lysophospholipase L1-like esterase